MTVRRVASFAWLFELLLPSRCASCGGAGDGLCVACRRALRPITLPRCARCGAPTAWPVERCRECAGRRLAFTSAVSAFAYAGPARPFLRAWKEHGLRRLAPLAAELVATRVSRPTADVITHIPPDAVRQLTRSCHPAEALAAELGRLWGLECAGLLSRSRSAERQALLPRAARRANVQGSFHAHVQAPAAPARVVLIDDIYTTGATASAAASALRAAAASHVEVVTFARAVR